MARVFPAMLDALSGQQAEQRAPAVRTRPVSPKDWPAKLEDATVTLAIPEGCETYPVISTDNDRLVLEGKPLGKFGPGDKVSFYHSSQAFTFEVHRVSAKKLTLWPR